MTQDSSLRRLVSRFAARQAPAGVPLAASEPNSAAQLATEFGASLELMETFVGRFAPAAVPAGYFSADADTMLFVHIPKTAGVSVGKALQESFDRFYAVEWNNIPSSFRKLTRQAMYEQSQGKTRQVIMGHFGWADMQVWRHHELSMKAGTILRDPVQRIISNFNYNRSKAHPAWQAFIKQNPTIMDYVRNTGYDVQLTQTIGIVSSFDDVLSKLISHYSFIGVTERLGASLTHLSRSHGLPAIREYRDNVGATPAQELPADVHDLILQRNHNDLKLHALMMRLFDLPKGH